MTLISDKSIFPFIKKYWVGLLFVSMLLLLLFYGLFWLASGILCLVILYKLVLNGMESIGIKWLQKSAKYLFLFLFVFMVSIGLKLLVVDIYRIPSSSMEDTLFPEDVILVNKLAYGPKLPRNPFEISWVNLLFYLNDKARSAMGKNWWPYKRLKGSATITQGDLLVYQLSRTFFVVKRCVAIAGDTLEIKAGEVYTNTKEYTSPLTVKNDYRIQVGNKRHFYMQMDSLDMQGSVYPDRTVAGSLRGTLSYEERERIGTLPEVKGLEIVLDTFDTKKGLFAMPRNMRWTLDDMGPFVIPRKGMTITLDRHTYDLYGKVLREHEGTVLTEEGNGYYTENGEKVIEHTFMQDYCFVMGDNRKGSMDSRYIGFVPEENIIGKVQYVLFSNYRGEFR